MLRATIRKKIRCIICKSLKGKNTHQQKAESKKKDMPIITININE